MPQLNYDGSERQMHIVTAAPTYISFLIRLWREESPELSGAIADWRGEVEHIQSGRCWTFSTLDALLGFMRRQAEDPDVLHWPDFRGCPGPRL